MIYYIEKKVLAIVFTVLIFASVIGGGYSVNIYNYGLETDLWELSSYMLGLILELVLVVVVLAIKAMYSEILKRL